MKVDLLEEKNTKNEAKIAEQEEEIVKLKAKLHVEPKSSPSLNEKPVRKSLINDNMDTFYREQNTGDSSPRAALPTSCRDLSLIGHSLDGLYLVKNMETNKIETVYCDFGTSGKLTLLLCLDSMHFSIIKQK